MRKIFSFLALIVCALAVNAASITAPKVDFGTVSIKGQSLPVSDSKTVTVTFSGLATDGYYMYAEVSEGLLDDETNPNGFYVSPATQYLGYGVGSGTLEFTVSYSVKAAGTYTGKLHWSCYDTGYEEVNGYTDITITVTNEAIVPKVTLYQAVNNISQLSEGDEVVFFQGNYKQVCAPFDEIAQTYLPALDAEYADLYHTQVYVPEGAQSFKLIKNSNQWIFHTDAYNLGASDKTLTQGVGAIDWSISFDNYTAIIKPDKSDYVIQFNSDRFKLYDADTQSSISLLKRIGDPVAIESKLEVGAINFGDVEQDDEDYVTISFTTENIDGGVLWDIVGADKDLFSLDESKADQGTLYINYLGTATKTGGVDAQLYAY
ncbi:MAG: hypothetical protein J5612_00880, partial [Paludibacteraceae bacterium]|nr:hypothetical protein [Paludibacteraceae bacterium]